MTEQDPTEPDRVPGSLLAVTLLAACLAIAAGALVVWLLASRVMYGGGRSNVLTHLATEPPSDPFALATAHELHRRDQLRALDTWQWADARHTRVRMPVELAIARYLGQAVPR
jgi:hypothetical protein